MNKILYTILTILILAIVVLSYFLYSIYSIEPKTFVKHYDSSNSNIFKDCNRNIDCKLQLLRSGCAFVDAVNRRNSNADVSNFNKKGFDLTKNVLITCTSPQNKEFLKAICNNNVCSVENKNK